MYDLVTVFAIILGLWLGWMFGVHPLAAFGLEMFGAFAAGVLLHEPLGGMLAVVLRWLLEAFAPDFPFQAFAVGLVFFLLVWGTLGALRFLYHPDDFTLVDAGPADEPPPPIEKVAGAATGGLAAFVTTAAVLVTLSMLPLPSFLLPAPQRMFIDSGSAVLRAAGRFQPNAADGVSLVVYGEPAGAGGRSVGCEPWLDVDRDGVWSAADRWYDSDGNGVFTESMKFDDVDGDGARRIGLVEKYATGVWGGSFDRSSVPVVATAAEASDDDPESRPNRSKKPPQTAATDTVPSSRQMPDDDF